MRFAHYKFSTIRHIADRIAENVTIRQYNDGNSADITRPTTPEESEKIYAVVFGALCSLNHKIYSFGLATNCDNTGLSRIIQAAKDTAEWTVGGLITDVNCYDTVYCPVWAMTELLWGNADTDFVRRYSEKLKIDTAEIVADAELKEEWPCLPLEKM